MSARELSEAARAGDPVALARLLVSIPSVNPSLEADGAGEAALAGVVADLLRDWGLDVVIQDAVPGRPNVVGRLRGRGPTILLNGHMDTVGVAGMSVPAFGNVPGDGRLEGRGACDMKGGLAAILTAVQRLAREEVTRRVPLIVAFVADEEHASVGMERLVQAPLEAEMAIVCEPTGLSVMPAHKGFVWVRATFRGRQAHGSRPELGVDAVRHAGLYLARLEELRDRLARSRPHPLLGRPSFHAGTIRGGSAPSIYAEHCAVTIEYRTLPGTPTGRVLDELRGPLAALAAEEPEVDASLEIVLERPGTEVPRDAPAVRALLASLERLGHVPRLAGMSAWVDAAWLNEAGVPAVCFGPGDIEQAHTADEWVDLAQIRACADVLVDLATELARDGSWTGKPPIPP